ncbi:DUF2249 domain-containing protein [Halovivax sp.]|uniref:DUF2249 domain-containing protein n=1 Tax=Halovivax sp. TaxID=1935978 RepID=UPI0025BA1D73|nr:DUF2249 domain-containing protein [Halovivax sp.]
MSTHDTDRVLDVRKVDGPPFDDIMAALDDLPAGERLTLIAPFEPAPLYDVLDRRGFDHETTDDDGLFAVRIERD